MEDFSKYNGTGTNLRRAQIKMLDILKEIVVVFDKHEIPYWIDFGTALGAVRHHGFIPWDDDLDITIPSEYYNIAHEVLSKEIPNDLVLQSKENTKKYPNAHFKVRDRHSVYVEAGYEDFEYKGIFVDIFPARRTNKMVQKYINSVQKNINTMQYPYSKFLSIGYIINKTAEFVLNLVLKFCRKSHYIVPFFEKNIIPERFIFPLSKINFEGVWFSCVNNTDKYLKLIYGDYMQIPEESKRITHAKEIIFLDK